jgi:hypothetical protein
MWLTTPIYDSPCNQSDTPGVSATLIQGVTPRANGGEGVLLDDLERLGMQIDGGTQLVALCEVCGRPSTKLCYACTARYCDFCSRKLHWKGSVGLHYPVTDSPGSLSKKIAEKQLEDKRVEDAKMRQLGRVGTFTN